MAARDNQITGQLEKFMTWKSLREEYIQQCAKVGERMTTQAKEAKRAKEERVTAARACKKGCWVRRDEDERLRLWGATVP